MARSYRRRYSEMPFNGSTVQGSTAGKKLKLPMEIPFTKMHGCGNDFIFIDCLKHHVPHLGSPAGQLCDRRFGIGADQLLTVHARCVADFKMEICRASPGQVEPSRY